MSQANHCCSLKVKIFGPSQYYKLATLPRTSFVCCKQRSALCLNKVDSDIKRSPDTDFCPEIQDCTGACVYRLSRRRVQKSKKHPDVSETQHCGLIRVYLRQATSSKLVTSCDLSRQVTMANLHRYKLLLRSTRLAGAVGKKTGTASFKDCQNSWVNARVF